MNYFCLGALSLLIIASSHAQDLSFEELENAPSGDIIIDGQTEQQELDIIDALTNQREAVERARTIVLKAPKPPDPEGRPNAFRAVLPKNTIVTRLSDDKDFVLPKSMQVWAQELFPGSQVVHVLDKENQPSFSARSIYVVSIEDDLKLTPGINPKITYNRSQGLKYRAYEKDFQFNTDISWEFESIAPNFWNQVFQEDMENGNGERYSSKIFYTGSFLPINFGLGVSYLDAIASSETFEVRWNALFVGPQISYSLYQADWWRVELEAQASSAIISSAKTSGNTYSPSAYEWGLASKLAFDTWAGTILAGAEYRRTYISLDKATSETILATEKESQSSTAFYVGYRFEFKL